MVESVIVKLYRFEFCGVNSDKEERVVGLSCVVSSMAGSILVELACIWLG